MNPQTLIHARSCFRLIVFILAGGLDLHAAEPFGFEQDQRINQLTLQFGTDTFATTNTFGHAFASVVQGQVQTPIAQAIADGSISLLFTFPGLADLTGTNAPSLLLGVVNASPIQQGPATYSGTSDLDWWYLLSPTDVVAGGTPLQQGAGSISNRVLNADFGRLNFEHSPLSANAGLTLFSTVLTASNGTASMPRQSANNFPPGHSPGEGISPALVSFEIMTQGQLKGNISALSLANTPVPAPLASGGATACTQGYSGTNSYLDLIVGGCTALGGFITAIFASQPDRFDTNAPVAGAGPPYTFTRAGTRVTGAHDHLGAAVSLQTALAASGYSAYFKFTTDRVIAFTDPGSTPKIVHTSKPAQGPFHLAFAGAPLGTFTVIASTNVGLAYTNWTELGTPTQTMYGLYEMTDSTTNLPRRFYRVRSP